MSEEPRAVYSKSCIVMKDIKNSYRAFASTALARTLLARVLVPRLYRVHCIVKKGICLAALFFGAKALFIIHPFDAYCEAEQWTMLGLLGLQTISLYHDHCVHTAHFSKDLISVELLDLSAAARHSVTPRQTLKR